MFDRRKEKKTDTRGTDRKGRGRTNRVEIDLWKARKANDETGNDSRELLTLSSPDHQSVTSLTRLGLGQDVLRVKNKDQYAGHRTGEGNVRRESAVFTAAIPHFLCLTTTLMALFPCSTASHTGFFH